MRHFILFVSTVTRPIIPPHPRPVLLRASILRPVTASTSPPRTRGRTTRLSPSLSTQRPPPLPLRPRLLRQRPTPSRPKNRLPLLLGIATLRPRPSRRTAPGNTTGPLQRHRKSAAVGGMREISHRPAVRQRGLKDAAILILIPRKNTSSSPV